MSPMLRLLQWCATLLGLLLILLLAQHRNGSITTDILIDRQPTTVWAFLTDTGAYPTWNPAIASIDGPLREGATIHVTTHNRRFGINTYTSRVLTVLPFRELQWEGRFPVPGLFEGERTFRLEALGDHTHLIQTEQFTGLLVGWLTSRLFEDTAYQMNDMDRALKQRVEASAP